MGIFGPPNVEKMKAMRDIEGLVKALSYNKDSNRIEHIKVRKEAATALGEIGDTRAVQPLIAALVSSAPDVAKEAQDALVRLGKPAVEPLISVLGRDENLSAVAAQVLLRIGLPSLQPLSTALGRSYGDAHLAKAVVGVLVRLGAPAVEPLIAALDDNNRQVRMVVAEGLGRLGDPRAVNPLLHIAMHIGEDATMAAAAIVKIGPRAVEPLITALEDENPNVRNAAAEALGKLGDPRAIKPLNIALRDHKIDTKGTEALVKLNVADAVEPLLEMLKDGNSDIRRTAAVSLGDLREARAVQPLITLLKDSNGDVRKAAATALVRYYRSGLMDHANASLILAHRAEIIQSHTDSFAPGCQGGGHFDTGIGVDFPL